MQTERSAAPPAGHVTTCPQYVSSIQLGRAPGPGAGSDSLVGSSLLGLTRPLQEEEGGELDREGGGGLSGYILDTDTGPANCFHGTEQQEDSEELGSLYRTISRKQILSKAGQSNITDPSWPTNSQPHFEFHSTPN